MGGNKRARSPSWSYSYYTETYPAYDGRADEGANKKSVPNCTRGQPRKVQQFAGSSSVRLASGGKKATCQRDLQLEKEKANTKNVQKKPV